MTPGIKDNYILALGGGAISPTSEALERMLFRYYNHAIAHRTGHYLC
jgi:hypothetical protein